MLLLLKELIVECDSWSYKFSDTTLYNTFCQFRVFQLVADCNFISGTHKSRQICLKRMMRETGHRNCSWSGARTLSKHDAQHLAGSQGILAVCLIKVTAPEQKYSFRMLSLHSEVLFHHRGLGRFLFCHISR